MVLLLFEFVFSAPARNGGLLISLFSVGLFSQAALMVCCMSFNPLSRQWKWLREVTCPQSHFLLKLWTAYVLLLYTMYYSIGYTFIHMHHCKGFQMSEHTCIVLFMSDLIFQSNFDNTQLSIEAFFLDFITYSCGRFTIMPLHIFATN